MSTDLVEILKAQAAAVTEAYRTARDVGYMRAVADAKASLLIALQTLLADVERLGFAQVSVEHPSIDGVMLARCAIEAWESQS